MYIDTYTKAREGKRPIIFHNASGVAAARYALPATNRFDTLPQLELLREALSKYLLSLSLSISLFPSYQYSLID